MENNLYDLSQISKINATCEINIHIFIYKQVLGSPGNLQYQEYGEEIHNTFECESQFIKQLHIDTRPRTDIG